MLSRRRFLGALSAGLLSAPLGSDAQPAGPVARVGVLTSRCPNSTSGPAGTSMPFARLDGQNTALKVRSSESRPAQLHDFATDLVRSKVDVIMACGQYA
jgi:hypothetical protein